MYNNSYMGRRIIDMLHPIADKNTRINDVSIFNYPNLDESWSTVHHEGQLSVDVLQTKKDVIIIAPMGGSIAESIEVYAKNDVLTIKGERKPPIDIIEEKEYFHQETFWGKFSRTVVLPVDVKGEKAKAEYKNGVLIVTIPKRRTNTKIVVEIVDD